MKFNEAVTDALFAREILSPAKQLPGACVVGSYVCVTDGATLYAAEYIGDQPHPDGTVFTDEGVVLLKGWGKDVSKVHVCINYKATAEAVCTLDANGINALDALGKLNTGHAAVLLRRNGTLVAEVCGIACTISVECEEFEAFAVDAGRLARAARRVGRYSDAKFCLYPGQARLSPIVLQNGAGAHAVVMPIKWTGGPAMFVELVHVNSEGFRAKGWAK